MKAFWAIAHSSALLRSRNDYSLSVGMKELWRSPARALLCEADD
jgi:hypothetical protein